MSNGKEVKTSVNDTSPYLGVRGVQMSLTLGATELALLRGFVRDVLYIIEYDDTGVSLDLEDSALTAAQILGIRVADVDDPTIESD